MADFDLTDPQTRAFAQLNRIYEREEAAAEACGCTVEHTEADVQAKYEEATSGQPEIAAELEEPYRKAKLTWAMLASLPHMRVASLRHWFHSFDELTLLFDDVDVPYQCPSSTLFAERMKNMG